jgi:hypothetical protein
MWIHCSLARPRDRGSHSLIHPIHAFPQGIHRSCEIGQRLVHPGLPGTRHLLLRNLDGTQLLAERGGVELPAFFRRHHELENFVHGHLFSSCFTHRLQPNP